jgi:plasmid stability protein
MSATMVQIRNVPIDFHRRLKARAAIEGMSMSDYILREVGKALDRPTRQEVLARFARAGPRKLRRKPADVIREERDAR